MNIWTGLNQLMAVASAVERRGRSDDLVAEIAEALAAAGHYVTRIDLLPTQQVVDFNWAAHKAGRRLGFKVDIDLRISKATAADGSAEVHVRRKRRH